MNIKEPPLKYFHEDEVETSNFFKQDAHDIEKNVILDIVNQVNQKDQKATWPFQGGFVSSKLFIIVLSFVMGLYEVVTLPAFIYQKEVLGMSPQTMQVIAGIIGLPWCIKPVFGYIIDILVLKVKKTKYIVLCTASLRVILFACVFAFEPGIYFFYLITLVVVLCSLFENIIAEYTLVISSKKANELNPDQAENHLPIYFGFKAAGCLIANFWGGRIIQMYSIGTAFLIASFLPMIVLAVAIIYNEETASTPRQKANWSDQLQAIKKLMLRDKVFQLILFICLINMTPNFDALYTFYLKDYLKFSPTDIANCSATSTICYIIGLLLYSYKLKNVNPKMFYVGTNFLLWFINVSFLLVVLHYVEQWGMSNKIFCLLNWGIYSLVSELNFMPILAIWCNLCPKNLEATSITLFTGLINLSNNLSNYLGAFLIWILDYKEGNYERMYHLLLIQNAYLLVAIIGISFVEFPDPRKEGVPINSNPESASTSEMSRTVVE